MQNMIEQLYDMVRETTPLTYQDSLEYRHLSEKAERLFGEIAADLGVEGRARLEALSDAQIDEDRPWRLSVFRRTLALGITLGRLGA